VKISSIKLFPLAMAIMAESCSLKMPTAFWTNFDSKSITSEINDQGPFGGHRAIFWQEMGAATFNLANVIEFATKNGWKFKDSSRFALTEIQRWRYDGKTIFPLSSEGFEPSGSYNNSDIVIFLFQRRQT
jgi:hypothetical protein